MDPVTLAMAGAAAGSLFKGIGGMIGAGQTAAGALQGGQTASLFDLLGIQQAQQAAQNWYNTAAQAVSPYTTAGSQSIQQLMSALTGTGARDAGIGGGGANLLSTFQPTQAQLEQTPGYQWAKQQTLGAMTNAGAAKGIGSSGNLVQQVGQTATGLASQTYQQQVQNYLAQNLQAYNMLMGPTTLGQSSANLLAGGATSLGGDLSRINAAGFNAAGTALGGSQMSAANAQATGTNALFGGAGQATGYAASSPLANIYAQSSAGATPQATLAALQGNIFGSAPSYGTNSPAFAPVNPQATAFS